MASQQDSHFKRFVGGKAQPVAAIMDEEPADGAVAKATAAVEDDQEAVADTVELAHTYRDECPYRRDSKSGAIQSPARFKARPDSIQPASTRQPLILKPL